MDTICSYLEYDHSRCDALFVQVVAYVVGRQWPHAERRFKDFEAAFTRHLTMEENIVFPAFEQVIGTAAGPTHALRLEHGQLRGLLARLTEAVEGNHVVDFFDHADAFRIVLQQHSLKEEGILYPMADRMLLEKRSELVASMAAISIADAFACTP